MTRVLLILSGLLVINGVAADTSPWSIPSPRLPVRAYLLVDAQSGSELAAVNAEARLPPASLTKLMTAYLLFSDLRAGSLTLDEPVTVSRYAAHLPGARMFLRPGDSVPVRDLFMGMLVQSGNDATFALIERVSGTLPVFVARMNAMAANLGLTDTHFANATGLNNPQHYSSARDLSRLALALRRDFPEYAGWFAVPEFRWAGITQPNRNPLLHDPGVTGLKTGHTEAAGYCLVASAERDGRQLIATLLGADSESERARSGRQLLEFGFRHFETRRVLAGGMEVATLALSQGADDVVALGVDRDVWITLPRNGFTEFRSAPLLPPIQRAPVQRGETLGQLALHYQDRTLAELPLVALASVPRGNLARRTAQRLRRWWHDGITVQAAP